MRRITFKPEFVDLIRTGQKTMTMRWKCQKWYAGEVRAAVTSQNGKPAFLTPAKDAFAHVKCTKEYTMLYGDLTDEIAARCGVTKDWYKNESPCAGAGNTLYVYEFEVVEE